MFFAQDFRVKGQTILSSAFVFHAHEIPSRSLYHPGSMWNLYQPRSMCPSLYENKQDRQCTYNVILRRFQVNIAAVEKQ